MTTIMNTLHEAVWAFQRTFYGTICQVFVLSQT